jgi:hypothetical protein
MPTTFQYIKHNSYRIIGFSYNNIHTSRISSSHLPFDRTIVPCARAVCKRISNKAWLIHHEPMLSTIDVVDVRYQLSYSWSLRAHR